MVNSSWKSASFRLNSAAKRAASELPWNFGETTFSSAWPEIWQLKLPVGTVL